jgi:hypothetical protein
MSEHQQSPENSDAKENHLTFASVMPALVAATSLSPDRIVEVLTLVLGSAGIAKLLQGSGHYDRKEFDQGARDIGMANAMLFLTALIGETIKTGMPGLYTAAELPFLAAAAKDLSKQEGAIKHVAGFMQNYNAQCALILNGIIHGTLIATGYVQTPEQLLTMAGFTALSTSFVMDAGEEGKDDAAAVFGAQNRRRIVGIAGTTALAVGSLLQTIPSIGPFLASGDIRSLAVVPLIWTVLNGIFLSGELMMLFKRLAAEKNVTALIQDATIKSAAVLSAGEEISPFEFFQH